MERPEDFAAQRQAGVGSHANRTATGEDERLKALIFAKWPTKHKVRTPRVNQDLGRLLAELRRHRDELAFEHEVAAQSVADPCAERDGVSKVATRGCVVAATECRRRGKEVPTEGRSIPPVASVRPPSARALGPGVVTEALRHSPGLGPMLRGDREQPSAAEGGPPKEAAHLSESQDAVSPLVAACT